MREAEWFETSGRQSRPTFANRTNELEGAQMSFTFESLVEKWDGLGVVTSYHRETGAWVFVALHDATLGRPTGGCRLRSYSSPASAVRDAMRLAEGMTYKWAAMGFEYGGGKSVLAVPGPITGAARQALFTHFGELLNCLGGAYGVGEDLGTTPEDLAFLATVTSAVAGSGHGCHPADPGPFTAAGVHAGIVTALSHAYGTGDLTGRSVLVQGVGDVGEPLAMLLARSGARVLVSDLDVSRARTVADECGGSVVDPRDVYRVACDVYAPCAVGATVSRRTIPRLGCRIVAGSANNPLERSADAELLLERGILYAPDYVINGGGAMACGLMERGIRSTAEVTDEVRRRIASSLAGIFREADSLSTSPAVAAHRVAARALGREQPRVRRPVDRSPRP